MALGDTGGQRQRAGQGSLQDHRKGSVPHRETPVWVWGTQEGFRNPHKDPKNGAGDSRKGLGTPRDPRKGLGTPRKGSGTPQKDLGTPQRRQEGFGILKSVQRPPQLGGRDGGTPRTGSATKEAAQAPQYGLTPLPSPPPLWAPLTVSCVAVPTRWRIQPRRFCRQRCAQPPAVTAPAPGTAPRAAGTHRGGTATAGGEGG